MLEDGRPQREGGRRGCSCRVVGVASWSCDQYVTMATLPSTYI